MKNKTYIGSELELFSQAYNWKSYYSSHIHNFLGDSVLEVGAGIGTTTRCLCKALKEKWICLEPDSLLADRINASIANGTLPKCCQVRPGTIEDLRTEEVFKTIIYIDVLEHIKDDFAEVRHAAEHLECNGYLIVLAPAHQWLFTPFDQAIGHYRRYSRASLSAVIPETLEPITVKYLDSIGLIATLGNHFLLKSKMPSKKQIMIWDRIMIPISRMVDPLLRFSIGKSVLGIWQKKI
ncbi:MAG: methyltransferase domain-containing protein [Cyanothece sp. SIO1E1]|nr:methyltransferase domain-containing protein [Cyanothece sp. SIO1E1]